MIETGRSAMQHGNRTVWRDVL